jgi:hypothetical protein
MNQIGLRDLEFVEKITDSTPTRNQISLPDLEFVEKIKKFHTY